MSSDPCTLSAVQARRLIGRKALSPVELLDACLARVEAANPRVNAVVALDLERARDAAREAERAVTAGGALGPLHGLPVGIKDTTETAGLRTTFGSLLFQDHVPTRDDPLVARLRRSGAIVLGKTNTPEFAAGANTVNPVYGATGNPFDPERTCGGSSGGSAVALATGMVPLATGSDFGGSLRIPAAWCGVVGFRPTPGLVPQPRKLRAWSPLNVDGPMARTVGDVGLMLSAMAGEDPGDPLSRPLDASAFATLPTLDPATFRVGVSDDLGFAPLEGRIRATFRERLTVIAAAVAAVEEVTPKLGDADETFAVLRGAGFLSSHAEKVERAAERIGANVVSNVRYAETLTLRQVVEAEAAMTRLGRDFQRIFQRVDVVIAPCTAVPPFLKAEAYCTEIEGVRMSSYFQWLALTYGLTLAACPVVCIPCGLDPTGAPFGIQVAGPQGGDLKVLAVAKALEAVLDGTPETRRPVPALT